MAFDWLRSVGDELTGVAARRREQQQARRDRDDVLNRLDRTSDRDWGRHQQMRGRMLGEAESMQRLRNQAASHDAGIHRDNASHMAGISTGLLGTAGDLTERVEGARTQNQARLLETQGALQERILGAQRNFELGMADRFIGTGAFLPQVLDHSADMARLHYGTIRDLEVLAKPQGFMGVLERLAPIAMAGAMLFS